MQLKKPWSHTENCIFKENWKGNTWKAKYLRKTQPKCFSVVQILLNSDLFHSKYFNNTSYLHTTKY